MSLTSFVLDIKKIIYTEIKSITLFPCKSIFEKRSEHSIVILTHNAGGGTQVFINNFIKNYKSEKIFIIYPISNIVRIIKYAILDYKSNKIEYVKEKNIDGFIEALIKIDLFVINSLVTYNSISKKLVWLRSLIERRKLKTVLMVHELMALCPNYTLTTKDFKYCEIKCLNNNSCFIKQEKIDQWRKDWLMLLELCYEVRTFDESIKKMFKKVYPTLNNITVIHHESKHFNQTPIEDFNKDVLNIGIVGNISKIKGKIFLKGFLKYLKKYNQKVYLFGKCYLFSPNLIHTGSYTPSDLKEKLLKYQINVVLFPSICPETFSYVVSEIITLNIPIVSFDIGAQGNRVKNYYRGIVCKRNNYEEVYNAINNAFNIFIAKK